MAKTRLYICPVDNNQVLFREVVAEDSAGPLIGLLVPEKPATCPECRKSYYKWECSQREVQE